MFELILVLGVVGTILIFVELFVPGMIAGVLGSLAIFSAVILTYAEYGVARGNAVLIGVLIIAMILFFYWMRAFPQTRFAQKWTLQAAVPTSPEQINLDELRSREGAALTALRPAGTALVSGRRIDVVAESEMIEAGEAIRVLYVDGPKVVVRRVEKRGKPDTI